MKSKLFQPSLRKRDAAPQKLPPGVNLVRTLRGHTSWIGRIAWSADGQMLASPSEDKTIKLWDTAKGKCLHTLEGHQKAVLSAAFDPSGHILASGSDDNTVKLWDPVSGKILRTLAGNTSAGITVTFDPTGRTFVSGSEGGTVNLWETTSGKLLHRFEPILKTRTRRRPVHSAAFDPTGRILAIGGSECIELWDPSSGNQLHTLGRNRSTIYSLSFDPTGRTLASTSDDYTIKLWDPFSGKLLRSLEGHTGIVDWVEYSSDGRLLGSKSNDQTIRLWRTDTFEQVAAIWEPKNKQRWIPGLAFHPHQPLLATVGSDLDTQNNAASSETTQSLDIHIWQLDIDILLGQRAVPSVSYTSAKVVLVGDSGVGKTGLGWRLAHGEFKEHASTHGQQFWLLNQLCQQRHDGTQCEAVLWDLAGQPDYRLIHALFLDDADLALVLFDSTRDGDPLSGVEFWLKQLRTASPGSGGTPTILVAARSDRGTPRLTQDELKVFCKERGIIGYLPTSAKTGENIDQLVIQMQGLIPWDDKPPTVTNQTFKRIKDFVLDLKENRRRRKVILTPEELRERLENMDRKWKFSDDEMLTAVGHLANHGYVTRLKTSQGKSRILLVPELLNNLAASYVLEARRNQKGLGSLEENQLLSGGYQFNELDKLTKAEKDILLDSAAVLFLEHNVCFRETDPHNAHTYLVFPELINLKRPVEEAHKPVEDGVSYTVSGPVENVYASLMVLMGYTQTFTRTNQWHNHARYEVGNGQVCGFRLEEERAGEQDFVLYFGTDTEAPVRMLFQSLFENFLARRNLTVRRFEPVSCTKGHPLNRAVVRELMSAGEKASFCNRCGEQIILPKADEPIQSTKQQKEEIEANRRAADLRSKFEQVLFRLKTYVTEKKPTPLECFISYAWGNSNQERWVERNLATDLQKAGISVVLDRWENARIGASVPRFVERVGKSDRIIVVGTPLYKTKYENNDPMRGFIVAAEGDLIGKRMIGTEAQKESVLPVLLEGIADSAFPNLLHGRVYADFRKGEDYFVRTFDLLISLYQIKPQDPVVIDLRESLEEMT